ncbi:MAG: hypothetical protein WBD47_01730 [Phormidesmis sp.]
MKLHPLLAFSIFSLPMAITMPAQANPALAACQSIADPIRRYYCTAPIQAEEARNALWQSYTPRQRQLATAVGQIASDYYSQTGQPVPVTTESVRLVMQAVGANNSEAAFVRERLQANHNASASLNEADVVINQAEDFLQCLQTQGTGCMF